MSIQKLALSATSVTVTSLVVLLALAQEPSPGGGGCLELGGTGSFVVCPDSESLDEDLGDFFIEVWIYPRRKPKEGEEWIIAAKPGSYKLAFVGPSEADDPWPGIQDFAIVFTVYLEEVDFPIRSIAHRDRPGVKWFPVRFTRKWHHIVARFHKNVQMNFNNQPMICSKVTIYIDGRPITHSLAGKEIYTPANTDSPLYVGGIENSERSYFNGCIDRLRISNVPNPDPPRAVVEESMNAMNFVFDPDRETLGLWHFDEPEGTAVFQDASGNGNTLLGRGGGFPVAPAGKLPAAWAGVKSGY
jgi:hypothetical protein